MIRRYDPHRKAYFNGKIGMWPIVEEYEAIRSSKNRPKGAICLRNIDSIDRKVYRSFLIDCVFPAIRANFPVGFKSQTIWVQQDNAKPHISPEDADIVAAGSSGGWNIRLRCQPPNSPDLNVLDLGYFTSIQCLQYKNEISSIDQLIQVVLASFEALEVTKLDDIFYTLQKVYEKVIDSCGNNDYSLPRTNKKKNESSRKTNDFICM